MPNNRLLLALACLAPALASAQQSRSYDLAATPTTVAWGYYWSQATPVLRIKSGDRVTVHTMITNSPTGLVRAGLDSTRVQQSLRDIYRDVTNKGPGAHFCQSLLRNSTDRQQVFNAAEWPAFFTEADN